MKRSPYHDVGRFFFWKYRSLATVRGIPYATKRMSRDGVPRPLQALILTPEGYEPPPKTVKPPPRTWLEKVASLFYPSTPKGNP